ncbi:MAG: hypothetical protein JRG96_15755, partial [Deltaproteobacteria bacterium]|nr:hypothetical protein [Deltaproteobacteria bacterium]MBW2420139.1 hypothetical protein [Deltaproteobacteria bacterium]
RLVDSNREQGLMDEAYARSAEGAQARPRLPATHDSRDARGADPGDPPSTPEGSAAHDLRTPHYPVFYTRRALVKAEVAARSGASARPPVETGGLLLGRLCWCPDTRTLYAVVEDVLEASHAEGTTYTLTFTGETWGRIQAVLRARQRQPATRTQRILGQCHGHSFLPYDQGETCDGCPSQGTCKLSTAYLSESDRRWCRAVFTREPWQLSHIFGLTPRREPVSAFYGQRGAMLERRPYYLLDDPAALSGTGRESGR